MSKKLTLVTSFLLTATSFSAVIFQDPLSPGSFSRATHFEVGTDPEAVAIGDLNEDTFNDLAVAD